MAKNHELRFDRRSAPRGAAAGLATTALAFAGGRTPRVAAQGSDATPVAVPAVPAESGYAAVNGLDLYYEVYGEGPPLILLHGGLLTIGTTFGAMIPTLSQRYRLIGIEMQAHGHTADIDRPMTFEAMADDVAGVMAYLGVDRADLFGYSLGGGVALQTAFRHPELARKLVIMSAPYQRDGWYPQVIKGRAQMNADAAAAMVGTPLYQIYAAVAPKPEDWPRLVTKVGGLNAVAYDWSDGIRALTAPVLIITGDGDSVRPKHAEEMYTLLGGGVPGDFGPLPPSQRAVLPGTAHSAMPARADLILPIVPPFLDAPLP